MTGQDLVDKVAAQKTVLDGLQVIGQNTVAFQQQLKDQIQKLIDQGGSVTPEQLQQVADMLDQNTTETQQISTDLGNALVSGTAAAKEKRA